MRCDATTFYELTFFEILRLYCFKGGKFKPGSQLKLKCRLTTEANTSVFYIKSSVQDRLCYF